MGRSAWPVQRPARAHSSATIKRPGVTIAPVLETRVICDTEKRLPGFLSKMSRAELFIAAGAALIILTDLILVIFGPYSFSNVIWAAAATALVLVLTHGRVAMMSWASSNYATLLSLAGLVAALVAIRELVRDARFIPGRSLDAMFLLGMVGLYVGVALMAFGAWQLWSRRAA